MTYFDPIEFDAQAAFYDILNSRLDTIGTKTAAQFAKEAGLHFDPTDFDYED